MDADITTLRSSWEASLRSVDAVGARRAARHAIEQLGVEAFGDSVLNPTLEAVGESWEAGDISLAEVYMAGRISTEVLEEWMDDSHDHDTARVGVAMLDDRHALGKNLVVAALRVAQLPARDLGTQSARGLADLARDEGLGLLLVSTLMLRSALRVEDLMGHLRDDGTETRVIVGGAPFRLDPELWERVGAHGTGGDAASAVQIVRTWMGGGA